MKDITTKTILFASLIAAMILPFSSMEIADAVPNENASDKVLERNWSNTDKQLKNDAKFRAYSVEDFSSYNDWTERLQQENIRNYNIETKIGHEVDGYELVALFAKKDILTNQYQPTETERFVNDWAFTVYDLPNNV